MDDETKGLLREILAEVKRAADCAERSADCAEMTRDILLAEQDDEDYPPTMSLSDINWGE